MSQHDTAVVDAPAAGGRPLRSDAERNRRRIIAVAHEVFAERGIEAGFDEIARRAGVGVGTVYRRFPARDDLVTALFEDRIESMTALAEQAAADPDPWSGLCSLVRQMAEQQVRDRGLREVMAVVTGGPEVVRGKIEHLHEVAGQLVRRAQEHGSLRTDVDVTDLVVLGGMLASVTSAATPDLWERYAAVLLTGLRADAPGGPLPLCPPGPQQIDEVMGNMCGRPVRHTPA